MAGFSPDRSLATRESLLHRLKDCQDHASWQVFYDSYRELIWRFALKAGCTEAEAEDVVQETVISVARNLPQFEYNPDKCAFKTWLLNLTVWRIRDQLRKRRSVSAQLAESMGDDATSGTDMIERIADPTVGLDALWEAEWRQAITEAAMLRVKERANPKDCQMFDLYVLRGWPPREVARTLRVSIARVYLAKHRVGPLLRKEIMSLERQFH